MSRGHKSTEKAASWNVILCRLDSFPQPLYEKSKIASRHSRVWLVEHNKQISS